MHELRKIFPYGLNDRIGDEFKTDNKHINVAAKFSSLSRKYIRANRGKNLNPKILLTLSGSRFLV